MYDINLITGASGNEDDELPVLVLPLITKSVAEFFKWLWARSGTETRYPRVFSLAAFAEMVFGEIMNRPDFSAERLLHKKSSYGEGVGCNWHVTQMPAGLNECARFNVRKQISALSEYFREAN